MKVKQLFLRVTEAGDQKFIPTSEVTCVQGELFLPEEAENWRIPFQYLEERWVEEEWTYFAFGCRWENVGDEQKTLNGRIFRRFPGTLRSPYVEEEGISYTQVLENTILIHETFSEEFPWVHEKLWLKGQIQVPYGTNIINVVDVRNSKMALWGAIKSPKVIEMFEILREKHWGCGNE